MKNETKLDLVCYRTQLYSYRRSNFAMQKKAPNQLDECWPTAWLPVQRLEHTNCVIYYSIQNVLSNETKGRRIEDEAD